MHRHTVRLALFGSLGTLAALAGVLAIRPLAGQLQHTFAAPARQAAQAPAHALLVPDTPAPSGASVAASVAVSPQAGRPTDTFTFVLAGFAPGETVVAAFTPPNLDGLDFPVPDPVSIAVDDSGAGILSLRPVDQGAIVPGLWLVTFTGQTSGVTQTASFGVVCGC
jgi:hypothetical protein